MVEPSRNSELRDVAALLREAAQRLERLAGDGDTSDVASEPPSSSYTVPSEPGSTPSPFVQPGSVLPGLVAELLGARQALRDAEVELARQEAVRAHALQERDAATGHLDALENDWSERVALSDKHEDDVLAEFRRDEEVATMAIHTTTQRLHEATARLADVNEQVARLRSFVVALEAEVEQRRAEAHRGEPQVTDAPVRLLALRALDELKAPTTSALLGEYIQVRFGREIRSDRWGALRRDEQRSYASHQRRDRSRETPWLCPAIDPDDATAVTSLWTRSDWPWSLRLQREDDEVLRLRLLYRLGQIALDPPPSTHDPDGLVELARTQLDRIRGAGYARTPLEEISERCAVIRQQLAELAPTDGDHDGRSHTPDIDLPPDPPWLDAVLLPDSTAEQLFGKGTDADIPF